MAKRGQSNEVPASVREHAARVDAKRAMMKRVAEGGLSSIIDSLQGSGREACEVRRQEALARHRVRWVDTTKGESDGEV